MLYSACVGPSGPSFQAVGLRADRIQVLTGLDEGWVAGFYGSVDAPALVDQRVPQESMRARNTTNDPHVPQKCREAAPPDEPCVL